MDWTKPERPIEHAERHLITAILEGKFPADSTLPGERELSAMLGVTRPTLREVLRRLERDGWVTIRQGKSTVVNDFWRQGGLNILNGIARHSASLPPDFVSNLLRVRLDIAPSYTRLAVERAAENVLALLKTHPAIGDDAIAFADFDWKMHHTLALDSGNPVYAMILNSFADFYGMMAQRYFMLPEAQQSSTLFYDELFNAAQRGDLDKAESVTRAVMQQSIDLWQKAAHAEELR